MKEANFLRYDPRLLEEAVFLAVKDRPQADIYHGERSRVYDIQEPQEREEGFRTVNQQWFFSLGLHVAIERALEEQPAISSGVKFCVVARAAGKNEEGAELFVNSAKTIDPNDRRTARILLRPESLLAQAELLIFLRQELFHVTDMLNPDFGYEPFLPPAEGGPAHDSLLRERYKVLWETAIAGRMVRRGWLSESVRAEHLSRFRRVFPIFGQETETVFSGFFDSETHTHADFINLASAPGAAVEHTTEGPQPGSRCSLCGFPTHAFETQPENLGSSVIAEIRRDFPHWRTIDALCIQCADIYRACAVATSSSQPLPGNLLL
ncbi:MAG: hypothetical protein HY695_04215 [Deltaproteobacteria bacterium]|nr:hypothetical protein [Deltaproteobacteria bacterium]